MLRMTGPYQKNPMWPLVHFCGDKSEYKPFFEAVDGEKADDEDEDNNVKRVEQEEPVILAGTDGAGKPDGMRQG